MHQLADNPKEALEQFVLELNEEYRPWYERSVTRIHWTWLPVHLVALFSGFAASILAALATDKTFESFSFVRTLLIVLPALGAAASTLTVQSRLHDWCRLRENGRRAMQDLYNEGRKQYAAATTNEEYASIHEELVRKVNAIEQTQGAGWFYLASPRSPEL